LLRHLVDTRDTQRYLILGSASRDLVKGSSESLAGRIGFHHLGGFSMDDVGTHNMMKLWIRGAMPRSYLAESEGSSVLWRDNYITTYLERDIPQLGIRVPARTLRRFWMMLAHYHGQTWNASELSRAMGLSDKTVRSYLDILSGAFMVRQLQPWFENTSKRQVRAPKIYLRDSGLLHSLLNIPDMHTLLGHPKVGASWEGYAIEQVLSILRPNEAYFWATHGAAELDLLFFANGKRYGIEVKFSEAPEVTHSMYSALQDLELEHLWVIYPGEQGYPVHEQMTVCPLRQIADLIPMIQR
jgi:predicted AAA+ superfamily ATPase